MTREEAIRILKDSKAKISQHDLSFHVVEHEKNEALDMAIKALEQEPCEDAISRAEVIDELNRIGRNAFKEDTDYDNFFAFLDNLPPVTPKPKTGHWYIDERPESDRETICSNYEQPIFKYHKLDFDYRPKYCPNCGVKMVEPQESEG